MYVQIICMYQLYVCNCLHNLSINIIICIIDTLIYSIPRYALYVHRCLVYIMLHTLFIGNTVFPIFFILETARYVVKLCM